MANLLSTILSGNNHITFGPNSTWSSYLRVGGNGHSVSGNEYASVVTTNGNLHLDSGTSRATYINYYAGTAGIAFGNGASSVVAWMGPDGDLWKGGGDNSGTQYVYNSGTWAINISGNAATASSAPANGGTSTYSTYLNPLSGDSNYKLAYTADGARSNAGEWGRAVMFYVPNGQTYGIRVDRADYSDNTGALGGIGVGGFLRDDGWNNYPGQDANTQETMRSDFTYSNNAPHTGELIRFSASGYSLQLNASYTASEISFRTRNGDNGTLNPWRTFIHSGNIGSQSVNYASSAGNADTVDGWHRDDLRAWGNLTGVPSTFTPSAHNHDDVVSNTGIFASATDGGRDCYLSIGDDNPSEFGYDYGGLFTFYGDTSRDASVIYAGGGTFNRHLAAARFYDVNDSNYYVDPNSNSYLSTLRVADASGGVSLSIGNGSTHGVYTADNARKYLVVAGDYYPHMALVASGSNNTTHGPVFSFVGTEGSSFRQWNIGISNQNPFLFSIGYNRSGDPNPHYGVGDAWSGDDNNHARLSIDRDGNTKIRGMLYVNGTSGGISTGSAVIHAGNIGSQSVSYASSAGNADTVDGYHATNAAGGLAVINANGYWYPPSWINVGGAGIYSGTNNAHFLPNNNSAYGSWEIIGSRGGWSGIYFRDSANTLMANSNDSGFYNITAGWQIEWYNGNLYISKQANGGGALATVIDSTTIGSQSVNYASSAGSATIAEFQSIPDYRGNAFEPNSYTGNRIWWHFNNKDAVGGYGTYWHAIQTVSPWSSYDPSHRQQQIQWGGTDISFRYATSGTTWSSWYRFITDANIASQSVSYATSAGNADTVDGYHESAFWRDGQTRTIGVLNFTGVGGDSGNGSVPTSYGIYQQGGAWTHPYPDLCIGYHTGIKIGAHFNYGGTRFYNNSDWASEIFSVGDGDNNVRVRHNLYINDAGGWITDLLNAKQAAGSYAAASHTHDDRYYTESEVDSLLSAKQNASTAITTGNIGSQSVSYATNSGSTSGNSRGVAIEGYGSSNFTFHQDSGTFGPFSGWHNYLIGNHGNGSNYYNTIIAMPFWGIPRYSRLEGGNQQGPWDFITQENIGSQSVNYATSAGSATNATNANRLDRYGIIYGDNWNSYYINNKLITASAHGFSGTNRPPKAYQYGSMMSFFNSGSDHWQMYIPENSGSSDIVDYKISFRSGWNGTWGSWRKLIDMNEAGVVAVSGNQGTGIEISSGVGYNQDPLTFLHLKGQADTGWRSLYIRLTGDATGQDIEFRRLAANGGNDLMWYTPRNQDVVIFEYQFQQGSDQRKKDNIQIIQNPIQKVKQLRGVEFDWNTGVYEGKHDIGVIAQDVEAIMPEAVSTQEDGYKTVAYTKLIPLLIETVKEQQALIENLTARLNALESK